MIVGKGFEEGEQCGQGMLASLVVDRRLGARGAVRFGGVLSASIMAAGVVASQEALQGTI